MAAFSRAAVELAAGQDRMAGRLAELRTRLRAADPLRIATNSGARYEPGGAGEGTIHLALWGEPIQVTFPGFVASTVPGEKVLPSFLQALLAYYCLTADGTAAAGRWIAFSELPDGQFYAQAFQGYTGHELAKSFDNRLDHFAAAAEALGGRRESLGDAAYAFSLLPRVELLAVCWQGDEDFPPSYRILFDGAVDHYLSTDICAVAGALLTGRLRSCLRKP
jgi:hypothetical protein